jgi:RNA polymerase sigma factor (sigma-70 family)
MNLVNLAVARPEEQPEDSHDADVIARSCREPELFALVFRRHAAAIARYVSRRLGPSAAEDVVAETFLAAFRQRDRYDVTRADALPWLLGIAGNLIRRHCRDEARMLLALSRTGADPVAESFTDRSEARVAADAASRAVAAALAELDPDQRDVVLLITWAELSYGQAAEALGIPEGTVRSRMSRARSRLRAALGGTDPTSAI